MPTPGWAIAAAGSTSAAKMMALMAEQVSGMPDPSLRGDSQPSVKGIMQVKNSSLLMQREGR